MTTTFEQAQLRGLSQYAIDCLNSLNERDQKALTTLRTQRSAFEKEIDSIDDVMRELESTIARRQAKARGDLIRSMPAGQGDDSQADDADAGFPATQERAPFDVSEAPLGGHS